MEFHVTLSGATPDPSVVEDAILAVDPAALVDIDASTRRLRIATSLDGRQLVALLNQAGVSVAPTQLVQLPSNCCGSCSG